MLIDSGIVEKVSGSQSGTNELGLFPKDKNLFGDDWTDGGLTTWQLIYGGGKPHFSRGNEYRYRLVGGEEDRG